MFPLFFLIYAIGPLIFVPYIAFRNNNWYILIGVAFCYFGVLLAAWRPKWFYPFPIFCIGFWIANGFSIHQYVTLFFFCMLGCFMFYQMAEQYDQLNKRGTLENDSELQNMMDKNPDYLRDKMRKWQGENPGKELTFDVIDALARGREVRESDFSGITINELTDRAVKDFYDKNPQILIDKIERLKAQNPGNEVTDDIIEALARNKKGTLLDK